MTEKFKFEAETDKIFKLMVHSLYENKDIFIRELISNASDALDKFRYEASKNTKIEQGSEELAITVEIDKETKNLIISDNGIGMNKEALIENLGTIARSGTQKFIESLTGDNKKDSQLIGQFGVGFYSAFMVADSVSVISKQAGEKQAYLWTSTGTGEYEIDEVDADIERGTIITICLKEGEEEFLDKFRVKSIIDSYSSHIAFKINFKEEDGNISILNEGQAIWLKNKSEIKKEDYNEYYKSISGTGDAEPWMTLHNKAEGLVEYTNLLFIPNQKPFDLYHPDRLTRVKLYIKRVLISEKLEIIPQYLRFLRGVVDSDDLPLNISRETVQNDVKMQKIRSSITKKLLKELTKKLEKEREEYLKFWSNFGSVIKEGLCDGFEPREEILKACLFQTDKSEELISLEEYQKKMQDGQKSIYFIASSDRKSALASPHIEGFISKGYEVIILTDSVDDFWVNVVHEINGLPFKSVTKAGKDLEEGSSDSNDKESKNKKDEEKKSEENAEFSTLIGKIKEVLGGKISDVRTTARLKDSPVCLTVAENAMDIRLERFMIENKQLAEASAKIFEINPEHQIIKGLKQKLESGKASEDQIAETVELLFAQANIAEGEPVPDIKKFTSSLNKLIEQNIAA